MVACGMWQLRGYARLAVALTLVGSLISEANANYDTQGQGSAGYPDKKAYKNFLRFGRGGSNNPSEFEAQMPDAVEVIPYDENGIPFETNPALIVAAKRAAYKNFLRFGRAGSRNFIRFGRNGRPGTKSFIRFGRSAPAEEFAMAVQDKGDQTLEDPTKVADENIHSSRAKRAVPNLFALINTPHGSSGWPEDDHPFMYGDDGSFSDEHPEAAIFELQKRGFNKNFLRFGRRDDNSDSSSSEEDQSSSSSNPSGGAGYVSTGADRLDRNLRARSHKNFLRFG